MRTLGLQLCLAVLLAMTPMAAMAQESMPDGEKPESPPAIQSNASLMTASNSGTHVATLRRSSDYAALLAPPAVELPTRMDQGSAVQALRQVDEDAPAAPAAEGKGSGAGLGFMIGGAAAFVGGLIIGGTAGTIIAAGGVGLGVYGAIIYF